MGNQKSSYWKFVGAFVGIILVVAVAIVAWKSYETMRDRQAIKDVADAMKQAEEDALRRAMADTYGGTTPQETLALYIDAVEKGDYELASKYFIGDEQGRGLANLKSKSETGVSRYISLLKEVAKSDGKYYSSDYIPEGQEFIIENPIYARMRIYPNDIWKIIEI